MQTKLFISLSNAVAVFFLCFCIPFALMFYHCLAREYDYNLMLGRGFISSNAVFFSVSMDPDDKEATPGAEAYGAESFLGHVQNFSGKKSYLVVSQFGVVRAVAYEGDVLLPPIISGQFFSSEQSRSERKLAVVGSVHMDSVWDDKGNPMITMEYGDYEVIGILGLQQASTIDELIFINAGSLDEEALISGLFYLDASDGSPDSLYKDLSARLSTDGRFSTSKIDMPTTAADVITGGIFYSSLLKAIIYSFLFLLFLCTLVSYIQNCKHRAALLLLNGYTYCMTVMRLSFFVIAVGLAGVIFSVAAGIIMAVCGFFRLPIETNVVSILLSSLYALAAMLMFPVSLYFAVRGMNLPESLR